MTDIPITPDAEAAADNYAEFLKGVPDPVTLTHAQLQKLLGSLTVGIMAKAQQVIDLEVGLTDRMANTLHEMVLSRNGILLGQNSGKQNYIARAEVLSVYRRYRLAKGLPSKVPHVN